MTYSVERMRPDLGEPVFHVVGVHCPNLFPTRGTQYFDDFNELINS